MLVVINFKDYKEAIGKKAISLVKKLDKKNVWIIINAIDLKEAVKNAKYSKILIEHADPIEFGAFTGAISFPEVKKSGAYGILLNHSEKRIKFNDIKKGIILAKKYKLKVIVSSRNIKEALKINKLNPDYTAIEPPKLISGKISISKAKPELIKFAASKIKNLLVGAGIHNYNDFLTAKKLGACGILISSAIIKNKNPKKKLNNLVKFKY